MIKLKELSALTSDVLKEWQDKETMDLIGDQVWDDMTEERAEYTCGYSNRRFLMNVDVRTCCGSDVAGENEDLYWSENEGHPLSCGNRKGWRLWIWKVRSDPEFDVRSQVSVSTWLLFRTIDSRLVVVWRSSRGLLSGHPRTGLRVPWVSLPGPTGVSSHPG